MKAMPRFLLSTIVFALLGTPLMAQVLEIWQIQGGGLNSNYQGQRVATNNNIVTAKGSNFFFIQTPPERSDNDSDTAEGLLILTNGNPNVKIGDLVNIEGTVIEEENTTAISSLNLSLSVVASDQELPPALALNEDFPSTQRAFVPDLERVENMRVTFNALVCGPPEDRDWIPVTTKSIRRFREAGILYPGLPNLPTWDGNPELFWVDLDALGQPSNRFVGGQMRLQVQGVMVHLEGRYVGFPSNYTLTGENFIQSVRPKNDGEFTIGCINTLRLLQDESAYEIRVRKMAAYIIEQLRSPDVVAVQEIGGIAELEDLVFHIRQLSPSSNYQIQFLSSNGEIHTAFLVQSSLQSLELAQISKNEFLSIGGTLHDRPPLLLSGLIPTTPPTPLKILNLHLRSLLGITGSNSTFVRTKRKEQAISVAKIVQDLRDENLVVVGDFNALPFSDGYVDIVNQIAGTPTEGALLANQNIVSPPLIKYFDQLPETERYSFIFEGNAQMIDHCLSTELNDFYFEDIQFARGNADNSWIYTNSADILARSSDHDGFVLFLRPKNSGLTRTEQQEKLALDLGYSNPMSLEGGIDLKNTEGRAVQVRWLDTSGRLLHQQMLQEGENQMQWNTKPRLGLYFVQFLDQEGQQYSTKILLQE